MTETPTPSRPPATTGRRAALGLLGLLAFALPPAHAGRPGLGETATRCGWFSNPTPGNAWLTDADGLWVVGLQGGHQAEGDWPAFDGARRPWVETNGSYGYGCACLRLTPLPASRVPEDMRRSLGTEQPTHYVATVHSSRVRPLAACRKDRRLPKPE